MNEQTRRREDVFNVLYDKHYAAVRAYAWRRDPVLADDVVAETFLLAWQRLESVPAGAELPWLLAVSRNTLLNLRRGERRRRRREENEAATSAAGETFAAADRPDASNDRVWHILEQLPAGDRELLSLVAWEGLDRAGIATVLGCSRANVALRLHRARRRFQALYESTAEDPETRMKPSFSLKTPLDPQGAHHD